MQLLLGNVNFISFKSLNMQY